VSSPSLTLVATGTTSVCRTSIVNRFNQQVVADLALRDMQRAVNRLERLLTPRRPLQPRLARRSRRSAWWPSD
jgi:hypothetical protein